MKIDTDALRYLSSKISTLITYPSLKNQNQQIRHQVILTKLSNISQFLISSASAYESLDNSIYIKRNDHVVQKSKSHYIDWRNLITKGEDESSISGKISYSYAQISASTNSKYLYTNAAIKLGDLKATGKVQASLWKDEEVDPSLVLEGSTSFSLLSGTLSAKLGGSDIYARASATGSVGTAYANAKAVLSADEQTLDLGVGVCALKGEVQGSFHFFGATVTITGQGTIGSAEANVSYHHSAKEWEFGSKLGFIAGLGFKVKVNY